MNEFVKHSALTHLRPAESRLASTLSRPKPVAITCIVILAALGWAVCALLPQNAAVGWVSALCSTSAPHGVTDTIVLFAMWSAMTLAMMLPTAGPMILTYAEIADTAAQKAEPVVSPLVLAAGYCAVWLGFASVAAGLQMAVAPLVQASAGHTYLAAALFLIAGLYQFSALKHACLSACQRPFPFFFARWTTETHGVFALGVRQGLYCLGCCWAMMLLMFVSGAMNVIWMAALAVVMSVEKMAGTRRFSQGLGIVFAAVAAACLIMEWQ